MIQKTKHIQDTKGLLGTVPTLKAPDPEFVFLATTNTRCAKFELFVKPGDHVNLNQVIGMRHGGFFDQPIHSSVSGTVVGEEKHYHRSGKLISFVKIQNDGLDTKDPSSRERTPEEIKALTHDDMTEILKNMACVGLGGSSFPTYIKFGTKNPIKTILVNAIECEPYISADHRLAEEHADEVLQGIHYIMQAFGCKDARICIKKTYKDLAKAYEQLLQMPENEGITLAKLGNFYPQGWEVAMIRNATGIQVEHGRLPSEYGVLNFNISTVFGIYRAIRFNEPVYERFVSVTGDGIKGPGNFLVRIGSPIRPLIDRCGGYIKEDEPKTIILGGPMMGANIPSDDCICTKTVTSVLVFHANTAKEEACIHCGSCLASCPVGLNPIEIARTMKHMPVDKAKIKALKPSLCIECGLCTYCCSSNIDLKAYVQRAKVIERLP